MSARPRRPRELRAVEIDGDDAAWLRGRELPEGTELVEVDEVLFWDRTYERSGSGLYLPTDADVVERVVARTLERAPQPEMPVGIDLFSGAGGFSLGLHMAGFDVVAAVEHDTAAASTYLHNLGHPDCTLHFVTPADRTRWEKDFKRRGKKQPQPDEWIGSGYRASTRMEGGCRAFFLGDIRAVTGAKMMDAAGVDDVAVVFGGPPCQGLSHCNSKACLEDPRNGLLWEFMRLVAEIGPKNFIIENVPAILSVAKGALFNALAQLANDAGYDVTAQKLDAVGYGVPQYRTRAIIVGTQEGEAGYQFPMPSHWALGRPVGETGWAVGSDEAKLEKELSPQATYDPIARTWSFHGDATDPVKKKPTRARVEPPTPEIDLFSEAAD